MLVFLYYPFDVHIICSALPFFILCLVNCVFSFTIFSLVEGLLILLAFSNNQLFVCLTFQFSIPLSLLLYFLFSVSCEVEIEDRVPYTASLDIWKGRASSLLLVDGVEVSWYLLIPPWVIGAWVSVYCFPLFFIDPFKEWGQRRLLVGSSKSSECPIILFNASPA